LFKKPLNILAVAILIATGINLYLFATADDLTTLAVGSLFADTLIALTLVPVWEAVRLAGAKSAPPTTERVRSGMQVIALYTLVMAVITFILFKLFGEPLIAERLNLIEEMLDKAIAQGTLTPQQKQQQLTLADQVYSPYAQVLVVILANLFVGFVSSILAALLVRK